MANKPQILIINNNGNVEVYSDIPVDVIYLDSFVDGLDVDDVNVVDEDYYLVSHLDPDINPKLIEHVKEQLKKDIHPAGEEDE